MQGFCVFWSRFCSVSSCKRIFIHPCVQKFVWKINMIMSLPSIPPSICCHPYAGAAARRQEQQLEQMIEVTAPVLPPPPGPGQQARDGKVEGSRQVGAPWCCVRRSSASKQVLRTAKRRPGSEGRSSAASRGAVDAERPRVHFSWKPILNSFKNCAGPRHMSRSSTNVTNLEPKHSKMQGMCLSV